MTEGHYKYDPLASLPGASEHHWGKHLFIPFAFISFALGGEWMFPVQWYVIPTKHNSDYCTSWNFRGGFIFANFARQTLAKISTSIYVYLYSNDNISKIAKLTTRELPHLAKTAK